MDLVVHVDITWTDNERGSHIDRQYTRNYWHESGVTPLFTSASRDLSPSRHVTYPCVQAVFRRGDERLEVAMNW